jgi:hypothetical protein
MKTEVNMKAIKASVLLLLAIWLSALPVAFAQESGTPKTVEYIVTGQTANLRSGPGTGYDVVGTVNGGDILLIYDETPETAGWFRIYREGESDAYIADFLVKRAPMPFYPADQEPILTLSGTGETISDKVEFPEGVYRVSVSVKDYQFRLERVVVGGDCTNNTMFSLYDPYVAQMKAETILISVECSYIFQTADVTGDWEMQFRQLDDQDAVETTLLTIGNGTTLIGIGTEVTMPTFVPEGIWTITATAQDDAFLLDFYALEEECQAMRDEALIHELDLFASSVDGTGIFRSLPGGCTVFWVTANVDKDWELKFEELK